MMVPGSLAVIPIQSTAGAIPVRNEKGQVSMQKVKVNRYISGKRPGYAPKSSSEEDSDYDEFIVPTRFKLEEVEPDDVKPVLDLTDAERTDPRLLRLQKTNRDRNRRIEEPEVLESESDEERPGRHRDSDSESGDELVDDEEIERRRSFLRQRALEKIEEELLTKEEEKATESEESESEYDEYTDSEEEARPRLKPVFVKKRERVTIKEKEIIEEKDKIGEEVLRRKAEEKRKETLKLVEEEIRRDRTGGKKGKEADSMANAPKITDVNTDDENEEAEYEAWKLRELKRIKRDKDEREAVERERMEIERMHNMTEDERRMELKMKPKLVLNKAAKGKYKFLQKYYHRGVFYLDKEDEVFKRDYSVPTLEDHFDKTILPKVMQVKNFGRSGRTKYTHLVDQDTTNFESPWVSETTQNLKFHATQAGGMKQVFDVSAAKKRKSVAE